VAHDRVRSALGTAFETRLERVATTAASQIDPGSLPEIRAQGDESADYLVVQVQLVTLRASTGVHDAVVLVDASGEWVEGQPGPLSGAARAALARALAGEVTVSAPFMRDSLTLRAGFAPVRDSAGTTTGAIAIESAADYLVVLADLGRTLTLIALTSVLAIAFLAVFIVRAARAGALLERRLSRAENLAAMGHLTATLAHEIKNPLAIIRGSAERLRKLDPEAERMAGFVIDETDRLSRTVARYLQFARGGPTLAENGDAVESLEATLDLLEGEFAARCVTLERPADPPRPAPVALADESLKQVYLNLILNALEALPEGGRVAVAVAEAGGAFEVRVADDGPGIPADVLDRVGRPFFTTKARGSGLGLFLTRRLVQTSGGDLRIESAPGRGTTCTVRLPRRRT
jgi:signal transduction histidine kinase